MHSERKRSTSAIDAIVLAGDREGYRPVCGENKAFLEIQGIPVIAYVVAALQRSRYVSRIFVVGPRDRAATALARAGALVEGEKEVILVDQWKTLVENAWNTFLRTLPQEEREGPPDQEERLRCRYGDKVVLYVGADLPLLTHYELDEFVEQCDMDRFDYVIGMTPEEALAPYYPEKGEPGIRLAYFHFKDSRERQNNLHMVRVFRVVNREYTQLMYRLRYQRRWRNILLLFWTLLRMPELKPGMLFRFGLLHVCRILGRFPWFPFQGLLRRLLDKGTIERDVSLLLKTRFGSALTTYGGAALDIDNKEHFDVICRRFREWRSFQEELYRNRVSASGPPAESRSSP